MAKTRFRTGVSRGLGVDGKVDRENHIIHGVAVCSPGEAKGHGVHVDREFTADVVRFGQDGSRGQRSRFGHPAMSANALGTHLGRVENFRDFGYMSEVILNSEPKEFIEILERGTNVENYQNYCCPHSTDFD